MGRGQRGVVALAVGIDGVHHRGVVRGALNAFGEGGEADAGRVVQEFGVDGLAHGRGRSDFTGALLDDGVKSIHVVLGRGGGGGGGGETVGIFIVDQKHLAEVGGNVHVVALFRLVAFEHAAHDGGGGGGADLYRPPGRSTRVETEHEELSVKHAVEQHADRTPTTVGFA